MIKRLLLVIALIFTIIGVLAKINPYIILYADAILILITLGIAISPSYGCGSGGGILFQFILFCIMMLSIVLWFTIFPFSDPPICTSTVTYPNGTILSNVSIICP